jgi:hypothetical protein
VGTLGHFCHSLITKTGRFIRRAKLGKHLILSAKTMVSQCFAKEFISKSTHVYPLLHIQRNRGNPSLAPYDGAPGNNIEAKFYSFWIYRRGGRSQVTMRRAGCVREASKAEIAEHGRWITQNRGYEAMSEHCNESTLEYHIYITLLCM